MNAAPRSRSAAIAEKPFFSAPRSGDRMISRRSFVSGLTLFALARVVAAQPAKVYRVAFITAVSPLSELTGPDPV